MLLADALKKEYKDIQHLLFINEISGITASWILFPNFVFQFMILPILIKVIKIFTFRSRKF